MKQYKANINNGCLVKYFKSQRIAKYPTIAAVTNPGKNGISNCSKFGVANKSKTASTPAANIMGIDMRNENLAASVLSKFLVIPPAIVDPDLEVPGNTAIT
jgi:hypothetical protein